MEEIGFLPNYVGTLIHDHNKVQYNFGIKNGECNTHILRYLQAVAYLAKLGGFLGRNGDGEPGAKVVWKGLNELNSEEPK